MEKDRSIRVVYIAGNGHSGSTLLDIILGSNEGCFSAGELTNITRDTIMDEYCSCEKLIPECEVWSEVIKLWEKERKISYRRYQQLRWQFERNKTTVRTLVNRIWPSAAFEEYCKATLQLLQAIKKITGRSVIIDSSKSPQRIAVLSKIVDLQVIHLCRDLKGVLNSSQKSITKDIKAGIEADIPVRRSWKVMLDWIFTNIAAEIFCQGVTSQKVFYENYVNNPESLQKLHPLFKQLDANQCFKAPHMLAGNALRLKNSLKINPTMGFQYKRLGRGQLILAKSIDRLFPYWS